MSEEQKTGAEQKTDIPFIFQISSDQTNKFYAIRLSSNEIKGKTLRQILDYTVKDADLEKLVSEEKISRRDLPEIEAALKSIRTEVYTKKDDKDILNDSVTFRKDGDWKKLDLETVVFDEKNTSTALFNLQTVNDYEFRFMNIVVNKFKKNEETSLDKRNQTLKDKLVRAFTNKYIDRDKSWRRHRKWIIPLVALAVIGGGSLKSYTAIEAYKVKKLETNIEQTWKSIKINAIEPGVVDSLQVYHYEKAEEQLKNKNFESAETEYKHLVDANSLLQLHYRDIIFDDIFLRSNKTGAKTYLALLERFDVLTGRKIKSRIDKTLHTSEGEQRTGLVDQWGNQISEECYDSIMNDYNSDQILNENVFAEKKTGYIHPEYNPKFVKLGIMYNNIITNWNYEIRDDN